MPTFDTVVIDADQMIYAIGFMSEREPIAYALHTVKKALENIQADTGADSRVIYVKGRGNFRDEAATTRGYKAHRKSTAKPKHFEAIYEYLLNVQGAIPADGMEADDKVSIDLYTDYVLCGGDKEQARVILSSGDKDLKNTPGWHYNPKTGEKVWYSDLQSTRHFWYQMLTGDKTDNILGLPKLPWATCKSYGISTAGIGPVGAKKLLSLTSTAEEAEELVYKLYLEWGASEGISEELVKEYILEQGTLLWMVRELSNDGDPITFQIDEGIYERSRTATECY